MYLSGRLLASWRANTTDIRVGPASTHSDVGCRFHPFTASSCPGCRHGEVPLRAVVAQPQRVWRWSSVWSIGPVSD